MIAKNPAVAALALAALTLAAPVFSQPPAAPAPPFAQPPVPPSPEKLRMIALGIEHKTAAALYDYFKKEANNGVPLTPRTIPDWTGVWTRGAFLNWDPDQGSGPPTAKLTAAHARLLREKLDRISRGVEFDPLSNCEPAGMPRWLSEPFLREFVPTVGQTLLINEMTNEIRRIYTDGREHPSNEDAYPLWEGDSIGFWDGDKLVIHTNQMRAGQYQRNQPAYTDQVETVEIWQRTDPTTMTVHIWVFDPPALAEPWYTKQPYKLLANDERSLRIRYWNCGENQNNTVQETATGSSDFSNFTFTDKDDN
jgi:hypothetical protein